MSTNYFTIDLIKKTHDRELNDKIMEKLEMLNKQNDNIVKNDDTVHIFIDKYYYADNIGKFIKELSTYIGKSIKIYFLKTDCVEEYTETLLVTDKNVDTIKFVVDIQKDTELPDFTKERFNNFLIENNISNYRLYYWKII